MAAIRLTTGDVVNVPGVTRDQVLSQLSGSQAAVTGTVNGVQATVRSQNIVMVADTLEGLRTIAISPFPDPAMTLPPGTTPPPPVS